ncbi:hypothetical protein, partial [Rhizobium sp. SEMIA 4085]|uniref:hypothetical protein n=1 Tax=Rhizobium sp. SEMIA 4085 TaxID=2137761 RepID=UPI001AEDC47E
NDSNLPTGNVLTEAQRGRLSNPVMVHLDGIWLQLHAEPAQRPGLQVASAQKYTRLKLILTHH